MMYSAAIPSASSSNESAKEQLSSELEAAHDELLKAMAEMATVTQSVVPIRSAYTAARWRLSKASRRRQVAWEQARLYLITKCGGPQLETLKRLVQSNEEYRHQSSSHVSRWPAQRIDADWNGYCEASQAIRWKMMSIVRHERRDVLPLLKQPT